MNNINAGNDDAISINLLVIIIAGVQFVTPFLESATFVALPSIGKDLNGSAFQLSMIQTAMHLGIAALVLPAGRFADIYGRKMVFTAGTLITCVSTLVLGLVGSIEVFILLRFIIGLGSAMTVTTGFAIITTVIPEGRRGRIMGIVIGAVYLGSTLGPGLSGFIIEYMGWRWIFYLISGSVAVILGLIFLKLKSEWVCAEGEPFEWGSAILFMTAMCLIVYGVTELSQTSSAKWLVFGGISGMVLFIILQWCSAYPILDIRLLVNNLRFTFSNLATFLNYASYTSFLFFFTLYLQIVKGFPPKYAGFLLLLQPLMQTVLTPVAGRLSDIYRPACIATIGMGVCTFGLFLASTIDIDTSMPMILIVASLVGASLGLFSSSNMLAIMASVEPRHVGTASSLVASMRSLGRLVSATIIAVFLSSYMGDQQVTHDNIDSFVRVMHVSLYFFCAVSFVGFCFSMVTDRPYKIYDSNIR